MSEPEVDTDLVLACWAASCATGVLGRVEDVGVAIERSIGRHSFGVDHGLTPVSYIWKPASHAASILYTRGTDLILAFRMTSSTQDLLQDLDTRLCKWPSKEGKTGSVLDRMFDARVHRGFLTKYQSQSRSVLEMVSAHLTGTETRLVITGHSLGGALSNLAAVHLSTHLGPLFQVPIEIVTFGAPKTGTRAWCDLVERSAKVTRISTPFDAIPRLPIHPRFHHAGTEVSIQASIPTPRPDQGAETVHDLKVIAYNAAAFLFTQRHKNLHHRSPNYDEMLQTLVENREVHETTDNP